MMGKAVSGWQRLGPRVAVQSLCSELYDEDLRHALVVDLSEDGLRIQRPIGGPRTRELQLELEIPEVDEIAWARGEIRFDEVWRLPRRADGSLSGVVRTSGVRIVSTTTRHRRLLREYTHDTWLARRAALADALAANDETAMILGASCYRLG